MVRDHRPGDELIYGEEPWRWYVADARAVLEAIREPDEGMLDAADEPIHDELRKQHAFSMEHYSKPAFASSPFSERAWRSMIDHILSERKRHEQGDATAPD